MAPLALVYAELGAMSPESGGPGRFAHHAFGSLVGATFGWFAYVQAATIAPIEVLAAIEYLSTNSWASGLYNSSKGTLSASGYVVAVVRMGIFVTLNLLGIRMLARTNSAITVFKLAIPSLTAVALILAGFYLHNFTVAGGFFVHGGAGPVQAILSAITAGGIAFALMGFEGALQVGGESTHPQRDLPRAVFGAFLVCTVIYIAVQVAFIGALPPSLLSHYTSWTGLATDPQLSRAPFFAPGQPGRPGLAGLDHACRCRGLARRDRDALSDRGIEAQLRAEQGRLRAQALRSSWSRTSAPTSHSGG